MVYLHLQLVNNCYFFVWNSSSSKMGTVPTFVITIVLLTRMHSSRMRTGRSLTVCYSLLLGGAWSGGVCSRGVSAPGEVPGLGGVCFQGGCLVRLVSALGGCLSWGVPGLGGVCSGGCLLLGGAWSGRVSAPRGASAPGGMSALGGVCSRGASQHALR